MRTTLFQSRLSHRTQEFEQALAVSEAGVERAIHRLNGGGSSWTGWSPSGGNTRSRTETVIDHTGATAGTFSVTVTDAMSTTPVIESKGLIPGRAGTDLRRTVRVKTGVNQVPSFFDWAIYAFEEVKFSSNALIDSFDSSEGPCGGANVPLSSTLWPRPKKWSASKHTFPHVRHVSDNSSRTYR